MVLTCVCLLCGYPTSLFAQKKDNDRQVIFTEQSHTDLTITEVNNTVTHVNGIHGLLLTLQLKKGRATTVKHHYDWRITFQTEERKPIKATNSKGAYADESGNLVYDKSISLTRSRSTLRLYDNDTEAPPMKSTEGTINFEAFVPLYAIDLPQSEAVIFTQFYIKKAGDWGLTDTSHQKIYAPPQGLHFYSFPLKKSLKQSVKLSVHEVEATHVSPEGKPWDGTKQKREDPDLQWAVIMDTGYKQDRIFTSKFARNTLFNRWNQVYSPTFSISPNDQITIAVEDLDPFSSPDLIGAWTGTVDSLAHYAARRTELSFDGLNRLIFNPPRAAFQLQVLEVEADKQQSWDVNTFVTNNHAPDLYYILKASDGKVIATSKPVENSYYIHLAKTYYQLTSVIDGELTLDLYDDDWGEDDFIGSIPIKVADLWKQEGVLIFKKNGVGSLKCKVWE